MREKGEGEAWCWLGKVLVFPAYFTQPSNLPEHLTDEAGNSSWLLLLLTPCVFNSYQDPKYECGDHWISSSSGCDTFNKCPSLLFAIVCLSALLSLSAEPSCLGRLIPRLSHKTVPVTAGQWPTDQSLASSTETSHLKPYGASPKADCESFPLRRPSGGAGTANWGWFVLVQIATLLYFLSNLIGNLYLPKLKVCSQRA